MQHFFKFRQIIRKVQKGERGGILVIALIMLMIGGLMIPPTLNHVGTSAKATTVFENETLGLYSADAGAEYGLQWLRSEATLPIPGGTKTFASLPDIINGSSAIQVTIDDLGSETYQIVSTADGAQGMTSSVTVKAHMPGDQDLALNYGVYALGTGNLDDEIITMAGSSKIDGSVYAAGSINMTDISGSQVTGAVTYACESDQADSTPGECATLTPSNNPNPTGPGTGPVPPQGTPDFGVDETVANMTAPSTVYDTTVLGDYPLTIGPSDPLILEDTSFGGSVKIVGDLVLRPKPDLSSITITIPGNLWVTGNIELGGPGNQGAVTIVFGGDVYVEGAVTCTQSVDVAIKPTDEADRPQFITEGDLWIGGSTTLDTIHTSEPADITDFPLFVSRHGAITTKGSSALQGIFYAPEGEVDMRSGADLYGVMICQSLILGGNNTLEYPPFITNWGTVGSSNPREITIIEWIVN